MKQALIVLIALLALAGCKKVGQCKDYKGINARITHYPCAKGGAVAIVDVSRVLIWGPPVAAHIYELPLKKLPRKFRPKPNETIEVIIGYEVLYPICIMDTNPCSPCENIAIHCIESI